MSTVAVCIPVLNDVEAIRITLPYTKQWADQVVIVDSGSTDGTLEFLKWFMEPTDKVIHLPREEALRMGWNVPRNLAAANATTEWVFSMEADCFLKPIDASLMKAELEKDDQILRVTRLNIDYSPLSLWQVEKIIESAAFFTEAKDWIYRRSSGAKYCGYVHEELYIGENRAIGRQIEASVYHLTRIRPLEKRNAMGEATSYRVRMASLHEELRFAVNSYWYEEYYSKNRELVDFQAKKYAVEHGLPEF